jgi:phosphohistidine swiveling domain-containing protein
MLVAARPLPQIAPLLWGCAGLVTVEGSVGAHLFEVARSLGVPVVTSPDFADGGIPPSGAFAAIDGAAGSIAVLDERRPRRSGSPPRLELVDGGAA